MLPPHNRYRLGYLILPQKNLLFYASLNVLVLENLILLIEEIIFQWLGVLQLL